MADGRDENRTRAMTARKEEVKAKGRGVPELGCCRSSIVLLVARDEATTGGGYMHGAAQLPVQRQALEHQIHALAGDASAENGTGSVGPLLPSETPTWKVRLHAACGLSRRTFGAGSPIPPIPAYTPVCLPLLPQAPLLMCRWG